MKQLVALALAALLTLVFLVALGSVTGPVARFLLGLDATQQAALKIVIALLCAVPTVVVLFRRRQAKGARRDA